MITKFELHTDVLVLGSGPAGFAAAYTAAKNGTKVILVEQSGDVGGISTSGLMSHWTGSCGSPLYYDILKRSSENNEGEFKNKITNLIDPEKLKTLYLEMLDKVGCKLMLYTFAEDAICDGDKVLGATIINKSGKTDIYAKVIIDATGDGDIAARAGAEFVLGRESDNKMQPATLMFKVGGVDYDRAVFLGSFESTYETPNGELQALAKEHIPYPAGHILTYETTLPGVVTCNMTNTVEIDGTVADDLTKAMLTCRRQMDDIVKYLRNFVPGYENCFIISSASLIGIRETRHFKGKYTLNEQDILEAKVFDDYVVKDAYFNFDVHNITGAGLDKTGVQKNFKQTKGYTIPYRCLLPEVKENLLFCGRNISGTHMAHSNLRVMPICVGIGEAAGAAAYISVSQNRNLNDIDAKEIREIIGI
ncbi:MAG: FAD-dependent oxidoreductase [Clostridia bacterium]|nr:FAD-dependent oxidoreductase [Clostridia bacterium]MBQ7120760.1 FAD-dependent oxidoreductase [Clostridia bacterium]